MSNIIVKLVTTGEEWVLEDVEPNQFTARDLIEQLIYGSVLVSELISLLLYWIRMVLNWSRMTLANSLKLAMLMAIPFVSSREAEVHAN